MRLLAAGVIALALLLVGVAIGRFTALRDRPAGGEREAPPTVAVDRGPGGAERSFDETPPSADVERATPDHSPRGPKLALIIDDLGRDLGVLQRLDALGIDMSFAVLPFETRTDQVARWLERHRKEVLVHLPMEPGVGSDPGPGALFVNLPPQEIRRLTQAAIDAVPGAVGVNNHMGSVFTANHQAMDTALRAIAERGLFFVDSRTTADTVGAALARELAIPTAERDVFLDRDEGGEAIREQFRRLLEVADEQGWAIAIGHPHPETLEVLESAVPDATRRGYRFVRVSALLERTGFRGTE